MWINLPVVVVVRCAADGDGEGSEEDAAEQEEVQGGRRAPAPGVLGAGRSREGAHFFMQIATLLMQITTLSMHTSTVLRPT